MAFDLEYVQDLIQEFDHQEPGFQAALDQRQSILKRLAFHTGILKFNTDEPLMEFQIKILLGFMNLMKESHPSIPKQVRTIDREQLEQIWEVDEHD